MATLWVNSELDTRVHQDLKVLSFGWSGLLLGPPGFWERESGVRTTRPSLRECVRACICSPAHAQAHARLHGGEVANTCPKGHAHIVAASGMSVCHCIVSIPRPKCICSKDSSGWRVRQEFHIWGVTLRAGAASSLTRQMEAAREALSSFCSRSGPRRRTGEEAVVLRGTLVV